jgi:hypothetical protein
LVVKMVVPPAQPSPSLRAARHGWQGRLRQ